jgi:hypothetical protein
MLEFSLAALLFSLLPFPLASLGLTRAPIWSVSGGAMIVFVLGPASFTSRLIRRGEPVVVSSLTRAMSVVANLAFSVILATQVVNLSGIVGRRSGLYRVGLFLLLFGASVDFVRLVWVGSPPLTR